MVKLSKLSSIPFVFLSVFIGIVASAAYTPAQVLRTQFGQGTPGQFASGPAGFAGFSSPDIAAVNPANGGLNMALQVGTIGGRGGFVLPVYLTYNSKVWSVNWHATAPLTTPFGQFFGLIPYATFGNFNGDPSSTNIGSSVSMPGWRVFRVMPVVSANRVGVTRAEVHPENGTIN